MKYKIFFFSSTLLSSVAFGAACCGGGAAFPTLITGDFRSQVSVASSMGHVVGDVDGSGQSYFRNSENNDDALTNRVEGGYQWSDEFQVGLSVPYIHKTKNTAASSSQSAGLGDIAVSAAYEILPVKSYSEWRPRGFLYTRLSFPTSPSIYSYQDPQSTDVRGSGFYTVSLGGLLTKSWNVWDAQLGAEVNQGVPNDFDSTYGRIHVAPRMSYGGLLSAGYSPRALSAFRFGAAIAPHYNGSKDISGLAPAGEEYYWDTTVSVNYLIETELMVGASYVDQTILGPVKNTTLSRTIGLMIQKRWNL